MRLSRIRVKQTKVMLRTEVYKLEHNSNIDMIVPTPNPVVICILLVVTINLKNISHDRTSLDITEFKFNVLNSFGAFTI